MPGVSDKPGRKRLCFDIKPRGRSKGYAELRRHANHPPGAISGQRSDKTKTASMFPSDSCRLPLGSFRLPLGRFGPARKVRSGKRDPGLAFEPRPECSLLCCRQLKRSQNPESPPYLTSRDCQLVDHRPQKPTPPRQASGAAVDLDADFRSKTGKSGRIRN